jgi:hypothetical protein
MLQPSNNYSAGAAYAFYWHVSGTEDRPEETRTERIVFKRIRYCKSANNLLITLLEPA